MTDKGWMEWVNAKIRKNFLTEDIEIVFDDNLEKGIETTHPELHHDFRRIHITGELVEDQGKVKYDTLNLEENRL